MKTPLLAAAAFLTACLGSAKAEPIIALTSGNRLVTFDSANPGTITKTQNVIGLTVGGESLLGIDFRPATGVLYALGSSSRIYSINSETGLATAVGTAGGFTLSGTLFGFDFNPTVDRIRITSDSEQNLRIHPETGVASIDPNLQYGASDPHFGAIPNVVGSAYTNSFSTAGATVLYGIDSIFDTLVIQEPANNGTLTTVGALGLDSTDNIGFDISGSTGVAYASLTVGANTNLYSINLVTGAATLRGQIGAPVTLGSEVVVDIAATVPPSSKLLNIATRGRVGQGDDVLIGGFITQSGVSSKYLLRAIGPSFSGSVPGTLADPVLTLYDNSGTVIATNDDWRSTQETQITATGLAPTNNAESAILATLVPSTYTAVVSGKGTNGGIAVVEVYQLQ